MVRRDRRDPIVLQKVRKQGIKFYHDSPKLSLARIFSVHLCQSESYFLFPYFLDNHDRILFLVSLLFVALMDPFDPYSPFKFLIFY